MKPFTTRHDKPGHRAVGALSAGALALGLCFGAAEAQSIDPARAPSLNPYGVAGMSQIISAEPVGAGRVNLQVRANFYPQYNEFPEAPPDGAQITTASGGIAAGLNDYLEAFAALHIYNLRQAGGDGSGFGTSVVGAQASIPFSRDVPLRLGAQLAALFGTSGDQINHSELDGYNYLETRTSTDVMAKLSQSLLMTEGGTGFKVHLNEGVISSFEPGKDIALLSGIGVEIIPIVSLILGLEVNSRTFLNDPGTVDPLWVTPSVTWRTPAFVNVHAGVDVSLSTDPAGTPVRALEPWRIFGGWTYSIDTRAGEKRDARERARRDSLERAALTNQARMAESKSDSLTWEAYMAERERQAMADSMARKAYQDSLALLSAERRLALERARRSEMEKQLLSTGLLVMDAVYFETGKTDISINSEPYLTMIAKMLVKYPRLQIEVGGHTDNVGGLEYNQNLSRGRSAAVVEYMQRAAPELRGRLASRGYAYSQPKASNETSEGRQLNRRTELKVLNRQALDEYR
jgi:outer membrane protein OmpA-like peptidoglycan-associated protein